MPEDQIEKLAKAVWDYYYPNGGSIYATYETTPEDSKEHCRHDAKEIASFLNGKSKIVQL